MSQTPPLELRPAVDFPLSSVAEAMTRGFEGYFVPVNETPEILAWRLRYDSIDLALSRLAFREDRQVGVCLVSPRGREARIAAMGVAREARRSGVGRALMESIAELVRERRYSRLRLEVIEQNQGAVALYRSCGLEVVGRLVGYELEPTESPSHAEAREDVSRLRPIDAQGVAEAIAREAPSLPWQLQPASLLAFGPPARAWALDEARAIVTGARDDTLSIQALWVPSTQRRQGLGRRLLEALLGRYPGRKWTVAARVPEGLADDFATALGFVRSPISQLEMAAELHSEDDTLRSRE